MSLRAGKSKFSLSCLLKDDFPIIEIGKLEGFDLPNFEKNPTLGYNRDQHGLGDNY